MAPSRSRTLLVPLQHAFTGTARCSVFPFSAFASRGRIPATSTATAAAELSARGVSNYSAVSDVTATGPVATTGAAGAATAIYLGGGVGRAGLAGGGVRSLSFEAGPAAAVTDEDGVVVGGEAGTQYAEGPCTRMNMFTAVNAGLRTVMETDSTAVSHMTYTSA